MSIEEYPIKEVFRQALLQMQVGCDNPFCLNPYCKVNIVDILTPREISLKLLEMSKNAPLQNLANSKEFIFCEQGKKVYSIISYDISYLEIFFMFSDPVSLGSSFRANSGNDWEMIEILYKNIEKFTLKLLLSPSWVEKCVRNWKISPYSILFIPHAFFIILGNSSLADQELIVYTSSLLSTYNLFNIFSLVADRYPYNSLRALVGKVKEVISNKFKKNIEDAEYHSLINDLDLLESLYMSNERVQRLPFEEFYIEAINDKLILKVDFKSWYDQINIESAPIEKNAFFWYPWIFNAASKSVMMSQEISVLMKIEIEKAKLINDYGDNTYLRVSRNNLLEDTLSQLTSGINLKKPLSVRFKGEEGVDLGGVKKEFFQLIIKKIFDPNFGMFIHYEDQRRVWFNPETLDSGIFFEVVGKILGLAIYNSTILDIRLPIAAYKKLLNQPVDIKDLEDFNPELVKGFKSLLEFQGNVEEVFLQYFSIETSAFGNTLKHELIPNGSQMPVTNENRELFINLYVDWWLNKGIQSSFEGFKRGFLSLCNGKVLNQFKAAELELLVCGYPELDFYALQKSTRYEGFTKKSLTIKYFWEIIHGYDDILKRKFLSFVSGSDRAPIGGLGLIRIRISRIPGDEDRLMSAHTCFNNLILPEYKDKDRMRELMLLALENTSGFGLI